MSEGAKLFVGHRSEGAEWVLIYDVAGTVYERRVAQWRPKKRDEPPRPRSAEEVRAALKVLEGGRRDE